MEQGFLPRQGDAMIVVDVQNDFLPGGPLAVPGGDEIIPVLNRVIERFHRRGLPIVATRDWHPPNHCSFMAQGGPWPPHCVQGTPGAQFPGDLELPAETCIVSKGTTAEEEAYSGFEGTLLHRRLQALRVRRLVVGGLATDYCVRATVLDALSLGYNVIYLRDGSRAVNLRQEDGPRAEQAMLRGGARVLNALP
jgi:nicotinamidase/pyrazinamidase